MGRAYVLYAILIVRLNGNFTIFIICMVVSLHLSCTTKILLCVVIIYAIFVLNVNFVRRYELISTIKAKEGQLSIMPSP